MPPAAEVPGVDAIVEPTGQHDRPGSSSRSVGNARSPPSVRAEYPAHPPGAEIPDDRLAAMPGRDDDIAAVRQGNACYVIGPPLPVASPVRHGAVWQSHEAHHVESGDDANQLAFQLGDADRGRSAELRDVADKVPRSQVPDRDTAVRIARYPDGGTAG